MALVIIDGYRVFLSGPLAAIFGIRCRFTPTCSCYGREALRIYGFRIGAPIAAKRFLRCHPWGESGFDPVAPNEKNTGEAVTRGT